MDKKLKEDKDAKRKGEPKTLGGKTEHLNANTDNVDVKVAKEYGNDYLDNLPDYLSYLKKEVGKKVREEKDAKRKGEQKNHKHKQTDEA